MNQLPPENPIHGLIYIKLHKAASSTSEGVALTIAHNVGKRKFSNSNSSHSHLHSDSDSDSDSDRNYDFLAYTYHEFARGSFH